MDLRQLRYFVKVAELSSFRAAADMLNVSQPALGAQVKNLEEEFDTIFFERHSRGVTLSPAGKFMLKHARNLLHSAEMAKFEMRRYARRPSGSIRMGVSPSIGRALGPDLLEYCSDRYSEIELNLTQGFRDELDAGLLESRLDMVFSQTRIDNNRFESLPLFLQKTYIFGVPEILQNCPEPAQVEDLVEIPLAMGVRNGDTLAVLEGAAAKKGLQFRNIVEVRSVNIRREILLSGWRCTIVPYAVFAKEVEQGLLLSKEVDPDLFSDVLNLNTRRVEFLSPAESALRQLVTELTDECIRSKRFGWVMPTGGV